MNDIILFGEMGAGKSSVAKYICNRYNYQKFSLGSKIHSECKLHGNETRQEMQQYGQMMRKIFGENIWCDHVINSSVGINQIVIDDARQLNEYSYFVSKGFVPIAVVTDKEIRLDRLSKRVNYPINPETFNHETEVQARECVKKCNIKIYNNWSDVELFSQIDRIMKEILDVHI